MNNTISILLVDDHDIVRTGFRSLLSIYDEFKVIGEAKCGEQALQFLQNHLVDVIVMDLSMPGIGGLESIRRILQRKFDTKILVFSMHEEQVYIQRALEAGAKGYISKNSAASILPEAILQIAAGNNYIEKGLFGTTIPEARPNNYQDILSTLSPREFDVFVLLIKGMTVNKIADQLCLSNKTVGNYSTQIKKRFHVANITMLTHIALKAGLIKT